MGNKKSILEHEKTDVDPSQMNDLRLSSDKDNEDLGFVKQEYKGRDKDGQKLKIVLYNDHMVIAYPDRDRILYYHHIERWQGTKEYYTLVLTNETEVKIYGLDNIFVNTLNALCSILATRIR